MWSAPCRWLELLAQWNSIPPDVSISLGERETQLRGPASVSAYLRMLQKVYSSQTAVVPRTDAPSARASRFCSCKCAEPPIVCCAAKDGTRSTIEIKNLLSIMTKTQATRSQQRFYLDEMPRKTDLGVVYLTDLELKQRHLPPRRHRIARYDGEVTLTSPTVDVHHAGPVVLGVARCLLATTGSVAPPIAPATLSRAIVSFRDLLPARGLLVLGRDARCLRTSIMEQVRFGPGRSAAVPDGDIS